MLPSLRLLHLRQRLRQPLSYPLSHSLSSPFSSSTSYERKTPLEHVLLRPGMYVGRTDATVIDTWVLKQGRMHRASVTYHPALLKIFDEILVNAADNRARDRSMTRVDVRADITPEGELRISVHNDGKGIPVSKHRTEKIYIPELVFGHLLTGSNFDDSVARLTGGSHGYGAKLTNIFSQQFTVETADPKKGLLYMQTWRDNMGTVGEPEVRVLGAGETGSYTSVTFVPDLARFGITIPPPPTPTPEQEQGTQEQGTKKLQLSDVPAATVTVADNTPSVNSFREYVELFGPLADADDISGGGGGGIVYTRVNPRWEIAVGLSPTGSFENISFVNNVWTSRGGAHVNLVLGQVCKALEAALAKKGISPSAAALRSRLMLWVNCKIENPAF
ncbi:histidine kinase-like ATPase, partial [Ochromonadaceae sp. CCMP2298]